MNNSDILFQIKGLHQSVIQSMMKDKNIKNHPSPTQVMILNFLIENKGEVVYQKDIENFLGLSRATVSDVLNTMEKNNIIKRSISKEDTRTKTVVLNKPAFDKRDEAFKRVEQINSIITKDIPKEDVEKFLEVLNKMRNNLDSTTR